MNASVRIESAGAVALIILSKPPLNIIDIRMMGEILGAIRQCERAGARIVQLEAAPDCRAFSAGVDVADHVPERVEEMLTSFHAIFRELAGAPFLTLALVRGACMGGGAELACFCDSVIAADDAMFGFPEIRLGCFPPVAAVMLPGLAGLRRALDWILTGREIPAAEAERAGLIDKAVPAEKLEEEARRRRECWLALSPEVLSLARRAVRGNEFEARLQDVERLYLERLMETSDAQEGIRAFLEKRAPAWRRSQAESETRLSARH